MSIRPFVYFVLFLSFLFAFPLVIVWLIGKAIYTIATEDGTRV